ncbi:hypothetical protein [Flavivirga algicola]|uniref:PorT family protein n=1 Tax=Flavivirga algicola TaxID=2729136 RepID=A0ABX1S2I0_9FLAO|nr:hypothetical protein [Flavivirga algicola]NMH89263.1 PorT family protein [Flavivirga algicola]
MNDKKHIDRLFQEGFKDFEAVPSDAVWENIEAKLKQKKKKRRVIPIWWRYAGAAALLLLLLTIGGTYFNTTDDSPTNHISETENTTFSNPKKDIPDNLNRAKETIADTNSNESKDLNDDESQQISNKINSSKESSITETSASRHNNESKSKLGATNQILNTENGNTVANTFEEKNDNEEIANKSKSNNAVANNYSEKNKDAGNLQKTLKNATSVASDPKEDNQANQQIGKSSINKKQTKDIINNTSKNNNVVANNNSEENKDVVNHQKALKSGTSVASSDSEKNNPQNSESLIDKKQAKDIINNASKDNNAIVKVEKATDETVINDKSEEKDNLTIEEAIDKTKDIIEKEENVNRWSITPNAAPVYFNTLGEGSSIDPQFNSNSKSGELNMSYGIAASYAINKKLSVRSGINRVNLGYNTNNVVAFQSVGVASSSRALQNVSSVKTSDNTSNSLSADNVSLVSSESFNSADIPEAFSTSNTSINQDLGYIEIPLEIQYALSDKKLGVNLIGGFSSFFLSNNKIFSESESGTRTLIGKANNINKISYSANLGLGLNYQVSKKIDLNLEPMFKYQINTFNNTSGDFKPFFIGVYTGFAIKF